MPLHLHSLVLELFEAFLHEVVAGEQEDAHLENAFANEHGRVYVRRDVGQEVVDAHGCLVDNSTAEYVGLVLAPGFLQAWGAPL